MRYIYVISVFTENTLRVLQRIAGTFARNRVNIEQLTVFETNLRGKSHFNIVIHSDERTIERVVNQLEKIVELFDIKITNKISLTEPEECLL